jgi:hypothetical protein
MSEPTAEQEIVGKTVESGFISKKIQGVENETRVDH